MNLTSPTIVRALCAEIGCTPSKVLGQNFLIDRNILDIIIEASVVKSTDVVLEVGPGLGVVTRELAAFARTVWAVEKDRRLADYLAREFAVTPNVHVIESDFLVLAPDTYGGDTLDAMISNLPFVSGSRILMELFIRRTPLDRITVTVQYEVAERLAAGPGTAARGLLGVMAQSLYAVTIVHKIGPTCFYPRPKVDSAIVSMRLRLGHVGECRRRQFLLDLVKTAFSFRRKQMGVVLSRYRPGLARDQIEAILRQAGIDPHLRPEALTNTEWMGLVDTLDAIT